MAIHMIKLCVGAEDVGDLESWQARQMRSGQGPVHHTRMMPKRAEELVAGGSIYWVIRKVVRVRQRIIDVRQVEGEDGRAMCELVFDPELVAVSPRRKRPFQGWRYLKPAEAPPDLQAGRKASDLPIELDVALKEAGVW